MRRLHLHCAYLLLLACAPTKGDSSDGSSGGATTDGPATGPDVTGADVPTTGASASDGTTATSSTGDDTSDASTGGDPGEASTGSDTGDASSGTGDSDGDALCEGMSVSDLDGVRIVFPPQDCVFTLDEVKAGVEFMFEVQIDAPIADVDRFRQDVGGCYEPVDIGIIVAQEISGNGHLVSNDNQGLCPGLPIPATELAPGVYPGTLMWTGVDWNGPHERPSGYFEPGDYVVQEKAIGAWKPGGVVTEYTVVGTLPITILP